MAVKSILILTAGFGEGHNAAARNLQEAIKVASPTTACVVNDVFRDAYGRVTRAVENGYVAIINHFPTLWQTAFKIFDRTRLVEQHISWYGAAARRLSRLIAERQPSVIVSTYPGCNHLLDHLFRKRLKRPFTSVTMITDSLTINSVWHRAHSDFFLVANDLTAEVLANAGVPLQNDGSSVFQFLGYLPVSMEPARSRRPVNVGVSSMSSTPVARWRRRLRDVCSPSKR